MRSEVKAGSLTPTHNQSVSQKSAVGKTGHENTWSFLINTKSEYLALFIVLRSITIVR